MTTSVNERAHGRHSARRSRGTIARDLQWQEVEPGFWVANADGNFGGTVERERKRYHGRDALGNDLGSFADAAGARSAVAERFCQALPAAGRRP